MGNLVTSAGSPSKPAATPAPADDAARATRTQVAGGIGRPEREPAPEPRPSAPEGKDDGFSQVDVPRTVGRYVLLRLLARGGMGEVYLASTTGLEGAERPVVVKVIRREHAKDPSFLARFLDEARVQAQLQHSGVAQVLDATMDERTGEPYVVVEHVEGRSLGDVRARAVQLGARLAWPEAVSIALMIAEALAHVHERQDASGRALAIVHRDLSPQNVMMSYAGDLKLIDFGTARGQNRRCHTVAGVVFAKPGYVAPEVANGNPGDARVDLYALGVMLWELCTGKRFLQGEAQEHMARVAKNELSPPPMASKVGAPAELDAIIAKLTEFERDQRYLAARVVVTDLAKLLSAAPALASGERGVRARVAGVMGRLFPDGAARARKEFARLAAAARAARGDPKPPVWRAPVALAQRPAAADAGLVPGTRYELCREIGRGASSVVYEARHVDLGRRVALKVLAEEHAGSAEAAERFRREARALSRLSNPAVVALHDFGVSTDGRLYGVMELYEGETLEAFLAREKGCDWREALALVHKALLGLGAVHAAGFVHRDVKPANLFLTRSGEIKILDFGLARAADDEAAPDSAPEAGKLGGMTIFGTPEYMAPEQAATGRVDARADLYALGCVLYELITGRLPFARESSVAILDAKIKGSPERPRARAPSRGIPAEVDELPMRAIARHPSVRFQTAGEMIAAVELALEAPVKKRAGRRALGFSALAGAMAFAVVLLAGQAPRVREGVARWVPSWRSAPAEVGAPAPETHAAVAPAPTAPPAEAALADDDGEDGAEVGELAPAEPIAADMAPPPAPLPASTPGREPTRKRARSETAHTSSAPVAAVALPAAPPPDPTAPIAAPAESAAEVAGSGAPPAAEPAPAAVASADERPEPGLVEPAATEPAAPAPAEATPSPAPEPTAPAAAPPVRGSKGAEGSVTEARTPAAAPRAETSHARPGKRLAPKKDETAKARKKRKSRLAKKHD